MLSHFGFLLIGLGAGAAYAAMSMALVMTYRSSGVINFATGAIAVYATYIYAFARKGQFTPMIPGLPKTVDFGCERVTPDAPCTPAIMMSFWPALIFALVMAALLGLLLYVLVFRPLRTAPPLARVVASIGIQVSIVVLITQQMGTAQVPVTNIFPDGRFTVGDTIANWRFIWTAVAIVVVAIGLSALYHYTRFGLATRAAAESEKGAVVSRIPASRIAALNWMLSSAVAGLGGIFVAPLISVVPLVFAFFVVPALAASVVARFDNIAIAVGAALAIGMLESEAKYLSAVTSWFPQNGGPELISLAVILGALLLRGKPLPERGALIQRTMGRAPRPRYLFTTAVVFAGLGVLGLFVLQGQWRNALITSFVFGIISLSYVVITGYTGQISLAQLTLAGAAGYMLSFFTISWDIPFPIAPIMAALVATAIGVVVGLPALRVRGLSVAVVTLALAVTVDAAWFRNTDIVGFTGSAKVTPPSLFGIDLGWGFTSGSTHISFGLMVLAVLTLSGVGVGLLRRSQLGSAMVAVRANERSAAAAGVNVFQVKIMAFAISSFIAGIGGTMLAYRYESITDAQFAPLIGLTVFATVYLAGITSVSGGIFAGFMAVTGILYTATNEWLELGDWYLVVTSLLLVITVIVNPEGITGQNHKWADQFHAALMRRKHGALEAPEPVAGRLEAAPVDLAGRTPRLEVKGLGVKYGGVVAVDDVTFDVPEGAIVGLIGPNGAGKTTLVDALSGFVNHSGSVELVGDSLDGLKPHKRVKRGLTRTFQAIELYDDLTVEENLEVGLASGRKGHGAEALASLKRTAGVLGLDHLLDRPAADLSQGQRQLVSIGRALVAEPTMLLLDEPAAGLDSQESGWLGLRLRDVRDSGVTILIVDHDVNLVLNLCDYIVVLDFGKLIGEGTPAEIRSNPAVIAAYLGSTHSEPVEAVIEEVSS
jgi:ABC-type branched-subunit amino acid transport system ATPase component/branched-subunit amino acid ABC-type transport system permease component